MKQKILASFLIFSLSGAAYAKNLCDLALTSGAFNTSDYASTSKLFLAQRDDVCSKEYDSKSEANSAARSAGGNLGYGGFTLGGSSAKQSTSGKWSVSSSEFCSASASELDSFTSERAKKQVADSALSAWTSCIKNTATNRLYVSYSLLPNGQGMTGTIHRSVSGDGTGFGNIKGISSSVSNDDAAGKNIQCRIGTEAVAVNQSINIRIDRTQISMSCAKDADANVSVSLITDAGDRDWIRLPSQKEVKQTSTNELRDALVQLRGELDVTNSAVNDVKTTADEAIKTARVNPNLSCKVFSKVSSNVPVGIVKATVSVPVEYTLTGGGCVSSNAAWRKVVYNYSPSSNKWLCATQDHIQAHAGTATAYAIGCKIIK